ncbi:hypothetical protein MMC16_000387 [Acarospora aff. strigata]|nr:hypothetical protein [Acarospora aff. strigata]
MAMSQIEIDERAARENAALVAENIRHDNLASDAPQLAQSSPDRSESSPEVVNDPEKCFNPKVWSEQPQVYDVLSLKHIYSRKLFWVLIVLAILVIGGAIGGGVGGAIAQRNRKERSRASPTPAMTSASSSPASTLSTSLRSPTTSTPSPTSSPVRRMGFSMQIWEQPDFQGRSQMFYAPGYFQTAFLARSYVWRPSQYTDDMDKCSMSFCLGSNELGWRGGTQREHPGLPLNTTWGADNINIACASNFAKPGCPGPMAAVTYTTAPIFETSTKEPSQSASTGTSGGSASTATEVFASTTSERPSSSTVERPTSTTSERPATTTTDKPTSTI